MKVAKGRLSRVGSGFISRDNDDNTAEACFRFQKEAGIPRQETVLWNAVPGWNGTRRIRQAELKAGIDHLSELIQLLPKLKSIVLVGKKAAKAKDLVSKLGALAIFESAHPSPLVRASHRSRWDSIPAVWRSAAEAAGVLANQQE